MDLGSGDEFLKGVTKSQRLIKFWNSDITLRTLETVELLLFVGLTIELDISNKITIYILCLFVMVINLWRPAPKENFLMDVELY